MNRGETHYYVRLEPDDRRYWHWWLARRDRLDVYHEGCWYALLAWKELIAGERPYPVEATLAPRTVRRIERPRRAQAGFERPARRSGSSPATATAPGQPAAVAVGPAAPTRDADEQASDGLRLTVFDW